jgi:hypothetical protein
VDGGEGAVTDGTHQGDDLCLAVHKHIDRSDGMAMWEDANRALDLGPALMIGGFV